jgi:hypothetical protein
LTADARVTLVNVAGQVLDAWQMPTGSYTLRMDISRLPKGVYAVSLENEQLKSVKVLVAQ